MSESNPYRLLGVPEDAQFEEVQEARARLLAEYAADDKQQQIIEMAYDSILMQRLRLRADGKIKVPERIRYPERTVFTRPAQQVPARPQRRWWNSLSFNASEAGISALVFAAIWLLYAVLATAGQGGGERESGFAVAVGLLATVYFLFRKIRVFWKAILFALGAAVVAVLAANQLQAFLAPPVLESVKGAVIFAVLWLTTLLLK